MAIAAAAAVISSVEADLIPEDQSVLYYVDFVPKYIDGGLFGKSGYEPFGQVLKRAHEYMKQLNAGSYNKRVVNFQTTFVPIMDEEEKMGVFAEIWDDFKVEHLGTQSARPLAPKDLSVIDSDKRKIKAWQQIVRVFLEPNLGGDSTIKKAEQT